MFQKLILKRIDLERDAILSDKKLEILLKLITDKSFYISLSNKKEKVKKATPMLDAEGKEISFTSLNNFQVEKKNSLIGRKRTLRYD